MIKKIQTNIDIDAPIEKVWAVLGDIEKYPQWNPFLLIEGDLEKGKTLKVTINHKEKSKMVFRPKILKFHNFCLEWAGVFLHPILFKGTHTFHLEKLSAKKTRLHHGEIFEGMAVRFFNVGKTREGFVSMNESLRDLF